VGGCQRPNSISGSSSDQTHSGACRSKGFVLGEDVPDGFGELARDVDPGDLRTALATVATLVPDEVSDRHRMAEGDERGVDAVLQCRPMADEVETEAGPLPLGPDHRVRRRAGRCP
jgi:hypothetical protein